MRVMPEILENAVIHVLSSMCFAMPASSGSGSMPDSIASRIEFTGEIAGELKIAIQSDLARKLAADFLALDVASVAPEQARLFSKELANVLCCETLSSLTASKRYSVSLPSELQLTGFEVYPYCFSIQGNGSDIGVDLQISEAQSFTGQETQK